MPMQGVICPRCRKMSPPRTAYCPRCSEVLDPQKITELQRLAAFLRDLDTRIAANQGGQTITDLREEYHTRYQELRRAPWLKNSEAGRPGPATSATAMISEVIPPTPDATLSQDTPAAQPVVLPVQMPVGVPQAAVPAAPPAPVGPVFSWHAFAADQAIAIMAYLGGFLTLVATLTLVVSKGENLPTLTLSLVSLVYLSFGAAGFSLRGIERLRTVSRVYLAVFALMTPLVALAIYRYQLQSLNFPVAGMLCISAVYASVVYLGLAVQTRFATYAYLGWTALVVAALSVLPWIHADVQWWVFTLGVTTLALIAPFYQRRIPFVALLAEPAIQLAALATIPTVMGVQVLGTIALTQMVDHAAFSSIWIVGGALALGACVLVPITAGWRYTVPSWRPRQQDAVIDTIDGFNAVFFAEAVVGVAIWIITNHNVEPNRPIAAVLAATALTEFGLALALYRWQRRRRVLRYFLEGLALGLASAGAFVVLGKPEPQLDAHSCPGRCADHYGGRSNHERRVVAAGKWLLSDARVLCSRPCTPFHKLCCCQSHRLLVCPGPGALDNSTGSRAACALAQICHASLYCGAGQRALYLYSASRPRCSLPDGDFADFYRSSFQRWSA